MKQHSLDFMANGKLAWKLSIQLFLYTFGNKSFYFLEFFFSGGDKNRKFQVSDVLLHSCSIITASLKIIPQYNVDVVRCLKHSGQLSLQSVTGRERVLAHSLYCIRLLSFCKVLGYHSQMQDHKGKRDCQWSYCGGWRLRTLPS